MLQLERQSLRSIHWITPNELHFSIEKKKTVDVFSSVLLGLYRVFFVFCWILERNDGLVSGGWRRVDFTGVERDRRVSECH